MLYTDIKTFSEWRHKQTEPDSTAAQRQIEQSWIYNFCIKCRGQDNSPSWEPPFWQKFCPFPLCPTFRQFARLWSIIIIGDLIRFNVVQVLQNIQNIQKYQYRYFRNNCMARVVCNCWKFCCSWWPFIWIGCVGCSSEFWWILDEFDLFAEIDWNARNWYFTTGIFLQKENKRNQ